MTTATSATNIINEMLRRWPFLGFAATSDSFDASGLYIVDASEFHHTAYGTQEFKNFYIDLYTIGGEDGMRIATTLNTANGRLSHGGVAWTGSVTGALPYRLLACHPDVIRGALRTAQQKQYSRTHRMLTSGHDFDMETAGVNYWDGTSGGSSTLATTPLKVTAASIGLDGTTGTQVLQETTSSATNRQRSEKIQVAPGRNIYTAVNLATVSGVSMTVKLYDATNGAYINPGGDVTYSGSTLALLERPNDVAPTGCYQVQLEFSASTTSAVYYVDSTTGPIEYGKRRFRLPTWLDAGYKLRYIRPSLYEVPIPGITGGRGWDASSRYFTGDWAAPDDFIIENFQGEGQPDSVNLNRDIPQSPLWISAERKLSETEPLDTETATTTEPQEKVLDYFMAELAKSLATMNPQNKKYEALAKEYEIEEALATLARPPTAAVPARGMVNRRA